MSATEYTVTIHRYSRETATIRVKATDVAGAQYAAQACLAGNKRCQIKQDDILWKPDPSPAVEIVKVEARP